MRLSEKQSDFMWMINELQNKIKPLFDSSQMLNGIYLKVYQWNRTPEEQIELVREGVSWTMKSKHLSGLAVDFQLMKDGEPIYEHYMYKIMGTFWESIGGTWGGSWEKHPDPMHYEYNEKARGEHVKKTT